MSARFHDWGLTALGASLLVVAVPTASLWLSVIGVGSLVAGIHRLYRATRHT